MRSRYLLLTFFVGLGLWFWYLTVGAHSSFLLPRPGTHTIHCVSSSHRGPLVSSGCDSCHSCVSLSPICPHAGATSRPIWHYHCYARSVLRRCMALRLLPGCPSRLTPSRVGGCWRFVRASWLILTRVVGSPSFVHSSWLTRSRVGGSPSFVRSSWLTRSRVGGSPSFVRSSWLTRSRVGGCRRFGLAWFASCSTRFLDCEIQVKIHVIQGSFCLCQLWSFQLRLHLCNNNTATATTTNLSASSMCVPQWVSSPIDCNHWPGNRQGQTLHSRLKTSGFKTSCHKSEPRLPQDNSATENF